MTATSPYIFMLILLIRNSLLDGARDGVEFYLSPNITKLGEMEVGLTASDNRLREMEVGLTASDNELGEMEVGLTARTTNWERWR